MRANIIVPDPHYSHGRLTRSAQHFRSSSSSSTLPLAAPSIPSQDIISISHQAIQQIPLTQLPPTQNQRRRAPSGRSPPLSASSCASAFSPTSPTLRVKRSTRSWAMKTAVRTTIARSTYRSSTARIVKMISRRGRACRCRRAHSGLSSR
jgi:hypothetical protein